MICLFCSPSPGTSPESPNLKLGSFFRAVALTQLVALNSQLRSSRADSLSCLGACIPVPEGLRDLFPSLLVTRGAPKVVPGAHP